MNPWSYFLLFVCSVLFTGCLRRYALSSRLLDVPNQRSSHVVPTPRGGGLAIVLTFLAGSWFLVQASIVEFERFSWVALCGGVIALIGFWDDLRSLPSGFRLTVHLVASFFVFSLGGAAQFVPCFSRDVFSGYVWIMLFPAVLGLAWFLNLYNFMDGIDGIAAVETMSVSCCAMFFLWYTGANGMYIAWLGVLVVATAGFLVWNWPPAKIFMGDACSGFLGLILGMFVLMTITDTLMTIWMWLILFGAFIVDATVTLLHRVYRKQRFAEAHCSHAYQILARRLGSHKKVTLAVLAVNVLWLFPCAFFSISRPYYGPLIAIGAYVPLVLFCLRVGAGKINA